MDLTRATTTTYVLLVCYSSGKTGMLQPTKFMTTRCKIVLAKRKSAKARSGEMPWKSALFCGLICILRQTV
jgi:hypothetical protein